MSEADTLYSWSISWIVVNILAFYMILIDKIRAQSNLKNGPRIKELNLLFPILLGGLPGTLIAMFRCNHKTRKNMFKIKIVIFVILYCTISQKIFAHFLGKEMVEKYQFRPYMTYFHLFYDDQNLPETVDVLENLVQDTIKKVLSLIWFEDVGLFLARIIISLSQRVRTFLTLVIELIIALILDIYDSVTK